MSSVKRRVNSTGRKRIPHARVRVALDPVKADQPLSATPNIDLQGLDFANDATIVFEAYQRSNAMRFELGTIANPLGPTKLELNELDPASSVLFRLKIVSQGEHEGRLLGSAERLRPASDDDGKGKRSLFPVDLRDLGPLLWKVEIGDAGPRLLLNYAVPGFIDRVQKDPLIQGVLLPAALKIVLDRLSTDTASDEEDEGAWQADWLQFCREDLRLADDPSDLKTDEEREDWVTDGVRRFCKSRNFLVKIKNSEVPS
jgi:hypothetical protein